MEIVNKANEDHQYHTVQFRCSNQLALLTTDSTQTGSYTRSVYVIGGGGNTTVTLIEGLKFHLYIAVPDTLNVHRLYEEMMLAYGQACYGRRAQEQLRKEVTERRQEASKLRADIVSSVPNNNDDIATTVSHQKKKEKLADKLVEKAIKEAKLITLNNQAQLHYRYRRLLSGGDSTEEEEESSDDMVPEMQPSREKEEWIKKEMVGCTGLFIIKQCRAYNIAKNARLAEKTLHAHRTYRFTFDNHTVLQYFIKQFSAQPLVIGGTYDPEQKRRVGGEQYGILVLDAPNNSHGLQDPSLYVAPKGDTQHVQYVLRQCQAFTTKDYVYQWRWRCGGDNDNDNDEKKKNKKKRTVTTLKNGCLEPAFAYGTDNMNTVVGGGGENIINLLNQNAVPVVLDRETPSKTSYRPAQSTLTFNLRDLLQSGNATTTTSIYSVSMSDKESTISLSVQAGSGEKKKRDAEEAGIGAALSSTTKKVALDSAILSPAAMTKMTHLPGQKKRPVQVL